MSELKLGGLTCSHSSRKIHIYSQKNGCLAREDEFYIDVRSVKEPCLFCRFQNLCKKGNHEGTRHGAFSTCSRHHAICELSLSPELVFKNNGNKLTGDRTGDRTLGTCCPFTYFWCFFGFVMTPYMYVAV